MLPHNNGPYRFRYLVWHSNAKVVRRCMFTRVQECAHEYFHLTSIPIIVMPATLVKVLPLISLRLLSILNLIITVLSEVALLSQSPCSVEYRMPEYIYIVSHSHSACSYPHPVDKTRKQDMLLFVAAQPICDTTEFHFDDRDKHHLHLSKTFGALMELPFSFLY